jgi:NAD-dependent deacetylase sirtuin 2
MKLNCSSLPTPPIVDLAGLAKFIHSPECRSIIILTGAGVSVASGIPDFRSPGGMYDTLRPELLTATRCQKRRMERDPTNVVNWDIFQINAFPYLEVRRPFILGTQKGLWKATIAHRFAELLHTKTNKLTRVYTQNIDGLDRQCDEIPSDKIVHVHGTLSQAACEGCGHDMEFDRFCELVQTNIQDIYQAEDSSSNTSSSSTSQAAAAASPKTSSPIPCEKCGKHLVKPKTVLFGRSLPSEFFERVEEDLPTCDLLIVAGTSLVVSPANSLVYQVPESTIRVVVNNDPVGQELGIHYAAAAGGSSSSTTNERDFFAQGDCDLVFLDLIQELGWLEDLQMKKEKLPPKSVELLELLRK